VRELAVPGRGCQRGGALVCGQLHRAGEESCWICWPRASAASRSWPKPRA
jgi:hypothetical protein